MKGTMTVRGFVRVLAVLVLSLTFGAGCNLLASDQDQALEKQKQKNEELQKQIDKQKQEEAEQKKREEEEAKRKKKEEEEARQKELEKQVEDLQKKVDSQDEKNSQENASQPTQSSQTEQSQPQQAEEQARSAAEAYYQAAAARNWGYTYDHLDSETQSAYTEQEWFAKNDYLADTGAVTYTIQSVVMDSSAPETFANVTVVLTATDGSTNIRNTYFVYEDGLWKHRFSAEEYDLLASAPVAVATASAGASASASSNASASATDDTKHAKIVITSSKPADVSINDDSLNWFITEEIVGTETYEKDIAANSGLSVSATTNAYHAQTTIEVYENGELVAQDSDPNGFAMVNY